MSPIVIVVVVVLAVAALGGLTAWAIVHSIRDRGTVITAVVPVPPGHVFRLEVPASATPRALWLRFHLVFRMPPRRGPAVHHHGHHGIVVTLTVDGQTSQHGRGALTPPGVPEFAGGSGYDVCLAGPLEQRELTETRKVCLLPGNHPLLVTGTVQVHDTNRLLAAQVWASAAPPG